MKNTNRIILILTFSLFLPFAAQADSWSCRLGNDLREVHVERPDDAAVPCKVVYRKLTEGVEDQELWNAQNDGAYCDFKASEFVDKLGTWGWTCVETIRDEADSETQ